MYLSWRMDILTHFCCLGSVIFIFFLLNMGGSSEFGIQMHTCVEAYCYACVPYLLWVSSPVVLPCLGQMRRMCYFCGILFDHIITAAKQNQILCPNLLVNSCLFFKDCGQPAAFHVTTPTTRQTGWNLVLKQSKNIWFWWECLTFCNSLFLLNPGALFVFTECQHVHSEFSCCGAPQSVWFIVSHL